MELRLSFDSIASKYNQTRIGYPREIYELASRFGHLHSESRVLEVGAGPGIATQELGDSVGCFVDVIEPGVSFCEILASRFSSNKKISIYNCSFEEFDSSMRYDAIFSATAFHWIDPKLKYAKSNELLSESGILVLYWNNYELADRFLQDEIQDIYGKHFPNQKQSFSVYDARERKIRERREEVLESGLFSQVDSQVFRRTELVSANKYVDLVGTFSENLVLDRSISEPFFQDIFTFVEMRSPVVELEITTNLEIARRV